MRFEVLMLSLEALLLRSASAGLRNVNLDVRISWQAQHLWTLRLEVHISWQAQDGVDLEVWTSQQAQYFVDLEWQISRQVQHFVDLEVWISWQAQYVVDLEMQILWQAQPFVSIEIKICGRSHACLHMSSVLAYLWPPGLQPSTMTSRYVGSQETSISAFRFF